MYMKGQKLVKKVGSNRDGIIKAYEGSQEYSKSKPPRGDSPDGERIGPCVNTTQWCTHLYGYFF